MTSRLPFPTIPYKGRRTGSVCGLTSATCKWPHKGSFEELKMAARFHLVNAKPSRLTTVALSWFLFAGGIGLYLYTSAARHRESPEDRVPPTIGQMVHGMSGAAFNSVEDDADQIRPASVVQRFSRRMLRSQTDATAPQLV